jgi:hypothetical protein
MSTDDRVYAVNLLDRTQREINEDFFVDWICFSPVSILSESASYCCSNETGSVIFIPKNYRGARRGLRELVLHECAHSFLNFKERVKDLKYVQAAFGKLEDGNYIFYRVSAFLHYFKEREPGYCSGYAMTSPEEDFAETFSFVLCNINSRKNWSFGGEVIDFENDYILQTKINVIKRVLRLD